MNKKIIFIKHNKTLQLINIKLGLRSKQLQSYLTQNLSEFHMDLTIKQK